MLEGKAIQTFEPLTIGSMETRQSDIRNLGALDTMIIALDLTRS